MKFSCLLCVVIISLTGTTCLCATDAPIAPLAQGQQSHSERQTLVHSAGDKGSSSTELDKDKIASNSILNRLPIEIPHFVKKPRRPERESEREATVLSQRQKALDVPTRQKEDPLVEEEYEGAVADASALSSSSSSSSSSQNTDLPHTRTKRSYYSVDESTDNRGHRYHSHHPHYQHVSSSKSTLRLHPKKHRWRNREQQQQQQEPSASSTFSLFPPDTLPGDAPSSSSHHQAESWSSSSSSKRSSSSSSSTLNSHYQSAADSPPTAEEWAEAAAAAQAATPSLEEEDRRNEHAMDMTSMQVSSVVEATKGLANSFMRVPRGGRRYDVPQIGESTSRSIRSILPVIRLWLRETSLVACNHTINWLRLRAFGSRKNIVRKELCRAANNPKLFPTTTTVQYNVRASVQYVCRCYCTGYSHP